MNDVQASLPLPSLGATPVPAAPAKPLPPAAVRVQAVDRSQMVWRSVDVGRLIEEDHPARAIWALTEQLDLTRFYQPIAAAAGTAGRTPWDPRLLVSLWVYGYSRGVNSARELARRCTYEPAFQWLCGLAAINYHTRSDFRTAHGPALNELFVELLGVLSHEGLVSLERVMHDGTKVKAFAGSGSFRREGSLRAHLAAAQQQVEALSAHPSEEPSGAEAARQRAARERQQRVEQALEQLEQVRQAKRGAQEKADARASLSDPTARVMKQPDGGFAPSYNVQVSTEASHKIIVAAAVSQEGADYSELPKAIQQIEANLGSPPKQRVVDGGFTCRENILQAAQQGIDLYGSWGQQEQKGLGALRQKGIAPEFYPAAFKYDAEQDLYQCPAGQHLGLTGQQEGVGVVQYQYRASAAACQACAFKGQCCPRTHSGRTLTRSVDAPAVRQFREKMEGPPGQEIYRQRAPVAEFPNAWLKAKLGLRQFRLRGLDKVGWEALWACLTYNVMQWIRFCWRPRLASQH
jgi:transposase